MDLIKQINENIGDVADDILEEVMELVDLVQCRCLHEKDLIDLTDAITAYRTSMDIEMLSLNMDLQDFDERISAEVMRRRNAAYRVQVASMGEKSEATLTGEQPVDAAKIREAKFQRRLASVVKLVGLNTSEIIILRELELLWQARPQDAQARLDIYKLTIIDYRETPDGKPIQQKIHREAIVRAADPVQARRLLSSQDHLYAALWDDIYGIDCRLLAAAVDGEAEVLSLK
jgi:hypothetical protein